MKTHMQLFRAVIFATTLVAAGSAFGQTPTCAAPGCNSVASDSYDNTASGTNALQAVEGAGGGQYNTASGFGALYSNTTGAHNTASGFSALYSNTNGVGNTASGNGALHSNTNGAQNTASGVSALFSNTTGSLNTASGGGALALNTNGSSNTASGVDALYENTGGMENTADGVDALLNNTTGYDNTANGVYALESNTTGYDNTANGVDALESNTTGKQNNASGAGALFSNTTADDNNAMGTNALHSNTTGALNNAVGNFAMQGNTTGYHNNAVGYSALESNTTGSDNDAQGFEALASNTTGNLNIAIGYKAGFSQTSGSQNIYLGNTGVAGESNVIRIGSSSGVSTQNAAFIAGISGNIQTGGTVVVTASGQLGVASSSRRYKQDIEPLGNISERLYDLRPVKFRYIKPDEQGQKSVQFGLIAEDVADVLPEVVYRNAEGKVEGVRYDELTPMLVDLAQKQQVAISALQVKLAAQAQQLAEIDSLKQQYAEMRAVNRAMQTELAELRAADTRVALR
jgi:hypothetical protein